MIEFQLKLRHPFELDVQFVIDAVDLLLHVMEQLPTPCRFAALWSADASFPACALGTTLAGYTSCPAQSPCSDGPARADSSDITLQPAGTGWTWRTGGAWDALRTPTAVLTILRHTPLVYSPTVSSVGRVQCGVRFLLLSPVRRVANSIMRIRLTRKLADYLDGIDLSAYRPGDVISMSPAQTRLLIAEGWAERMSDDVRSVSSHFAVAAEMATRRTIDQLRHAVRRIGQQRFETDKRRRADDRIREDLHDSLARTI